MHDGYKILSRYLEVGIGSGALLLHIYDGYKMRFTWTVTAHDGYKILSRYLQVSIIGSGALLHMMATRYYPVTWKSISAVERYCYNTALQRCGSSRIEA